MQDKEVEVITINDILYAIVESLDEYVYAVNPDDNEDIKILKKSSDEELEEVDEFEKKVALERFYEQYSYLDKNRE